MKEIKKDINSVKRELTSLTETASNINDTVNNLIGDVEQHKKGVESINDLMRGDLKSVKKKFEAY